MSELADRSLDATQAERLVDLFGSFGPRYRRFMQAQAGVEGVSPARLRLLRTLRCCDAEGVPMGRLGERLGITPRAVTALVDGLEADGLAERRPHPTDRRTTLVAITAAGEDLHRRSRERSRAAAAQLFAALSDEDQAGLEHALEALLEHLA